jgi:hypothetical protein
MKNNLIIALNAIEKHEVELTLLGDLQKALTDLKEAPLTMNNNVKVFKQFQLQVNEAMKGYNYNKEQLTINLQKYQDSFDRTGKIMNDLSISAKELGLNVSDIKGYSDLQKLHQSLITSISDVKKAIATIKF